MRIAMLTNNYKPFVGGVPISIERQAKALRELGHEVMIFAPDYGDTEEEEGVIRCRIRKRRTGLCSPGTGYRVFILIRSFLIIRFP